MDTTIKPRWLPERRFGGFLSTSSTTDPPTTTTTTTMATLVESFSTSISQLEVPSSRGFSDDDNIHLMGLKLILTGVGGFLLFLFLIFLILFLLGKKMDCSCNCCSCPRNTIPIPSIDLGMSNKCRPDTGRGRLVKSKDNQVAVDLISL